MKRIAMVVLLVMAATLLAHAQEQTLLGEGKMEYGGYGGPVVKFTSINGNAAVLVGGKGGWIINHTFILGGAGYGLVNNVDARVASPLGEPYVDFGYGGLTLEGIVCSDQLVHLSVETLIGGGTVGFRNDWTNYDRHDDRTYDGVFVLEPGVNVQLNVASWFRADIGGSYRYVSGVSIPASSNADLRGFAGSLSLRFGKF